MSIAASWVRLGRMNYADALQKQKDRVTALLSGQDDEQTIFTVEHPPTITIGRNGSNDHIVASKDRLAELGFEVYAVDRGGDVTYHGPGQLVVYPILHLSPWNNDVGGYVRRLEETVIRALGEVGITAGRIEGLPGVWVGDAKVCAIGARMQRRPSGEFVTSHGLALNVNTDLTHFSTIVPCGIHDKGVTSVAELLNEKVSFDEWENRLQRAFVEVFDLSL